MRGEEDHPLQVDLQDETSFVPLEVKRVHLVGGNPPNGTSLAQRFNRLLALPACRVLIPAPFPPKPGEVSL